MSNVKRVQAPSQTYILKFPITRTEGVEITSVQYDRPKGKHLKKLPMAALEGSGIEFEAMFPFLSKWVNVPLDVLDEMDMTDIICLMEKLEPFLPQASKIGKK